MPEPFRRLRIAIATASQLGVRPVTELAMYQAGLRLGLWKRLTLPQPHRGPVPQIDFPFKLLNNTQYLSIAASSRQEIILEADEIRQGKARLFGGPAVPLILNTAPPLNHWTEYEMGRSPWGEEDPKLVWEPARFGWALVLGRAFLLTGDQIFAETFWKYLEIFVKSNPPYMGPNWASAQEVAIRLICLAFAGFMVRESGGSSKDRIELLSSTLAEHARRIPPTMGYARAQNNNHLLSEAAGLYTAGVLLPSHPQASAWRHLGWTRFNRAITEQIDSDGEYIQHSTNYHRLMLHLALWVNLLSKKTSQPLPLTSIQTIQRSIKWLVDRVDPQNGHVPNYGNNDGANIFPLAAVDFGDYRPTIQAASAAFTGKFACPEGNWDEMAYWFGEKDAAPAQNPVGDVHKPRVYLTANHFHNRPAHADQLHMDIWWNGINVAMDGGTYRYTAPPPWDNALSRTSIHNTITIDDQDQMERAGKFLWINWAQAAFTKNDGNGGSARHYGYTKKLGLVHQRSWAMNNSSEIDVIDRITSVKNNFESHQFSLHWLLPDWPWMMNGSGLTLTSPQGEIQVGWELIDPSTKILLKVDLVRAGENLAGTLKPNPIDGWVAPTYDQKIPALSLSIIAQQTPPFQIRTHWKFPAP